MRVTTCPDCGEVVEIPPPGADTDDVEVVCQVCGLAAPAGEWWEHVAEEDDSLLGVPLADATIPASVPKRWALRVEQLEEIREVVGELTHQVRLLRQALDELNQDLPERVKHWFEGWHQEYLPVEELVNAVVASLPKSAAPYSPAGTSATAKARRSTSPAAQNQTGLW